MIPEWIAEAYITLGMNLGIIVAIALILIDRDIDRRLYINKLENEFCR